MLKILKVFRPIDWLLALLAVAFIGTQVYCDLALPDYMGEIVDLIQGGGAVSEIWAVGLKMLGMVGISVLSVIIVSFISSVLAAGFSKRLRRKLFEKVNSFSAAEMNAFSTSGLITRSTNDITQVQSAVMMFLRLAVAAPFMATAAIVKILNKSFELTAVTMAGIGILVIIIITVFIIAVPKFTKIQKITDSLNRVTRESLTGLRVVRAYNAEAEEERKFEETNEELTSTNFYVGKVMATMMPAMQFLMSGLALSIIWIGGYLVDARKLVLSDMFVFTQYSMQILMSFMMLSMLFIIMPRALVSAKRISEVLYKDISIKDNESTVMEAQNAEKDAVRFENVSFMYPDSRDYALKDISFTANRGETVAFIGSTGSGKTTLINLIPRFYDANEGGVYVNGVNVKDYNLKELYGKLGYVPQRNMLFGGSIGYNAGYGTPEAETAEIEEALRVSQADFVFGLSEGMDYNVAQGGKNLSGGQRQRLSIARAIVKKPEILIFDDSFSALDYKTDRELRRALKEKFKGVTTLIVAQRVGTIMDADKIIVLDEGRIESEGKHKDLLKTSKIYRDIAYSQLGAEGAENAR